ncbi:MAG: mannose-6-phosphate isomerase type 1 [Erysipelotrichaceae bacterium]|nr:MAG: mannose-6-phosphate isomerase type [Erysipelotrichaceae bacterium]TXT17647.1 MAG: mannose-6-phosphate isomerase type 1 [Erysipelotrichaceae bacterium]
MALYKLAPVFKEMIWGGSKLKTDFEFSFTSNQIGEAWVISAHQNGDCLFTTGEFTGQALSEVYKQNRKLFGHGDNMKFPLLVKIIDANQNLSIQVHPDDEYALLHEQSYGKTECWFILDCPPKTPLIIDHHAENHQELVDAAHNGSILDKLSVIEIEKGDFFFIPAGTIHAICANTILYEVQQNSDVTYRLYDYERVDIQGNPRQLHLEKGLDVIQSNKSQIKPVPDIKQLPSATITTLVKSKYFSLTKIENRGLLDYELEGEFSLVGCIEGELTINDILFSKGEHAIITHDTRHIILNGHGIALISTPGEILL